MIYLTDKIEFPSVENASLEGLVALGGDLSVARLILAYESGIFPWFNDDRLLMWWSPDPRMVLFPESLKVSKSMKKVIANNRFEVTFNQDFNQVITACAAAKRKDQDGTWITPAMIESYVKLNALGKALSVEVWEEDKLVGGLYGVLTGQVFSGESMFAKVSNASKLAFIELVAMLEEIGVTLIDCQMYTDHLASLGAEEISREVFLSYL
jgi:leucyl/phenylalanyl-tRNA--protein transferase